jgi:hypothetical protein
MTLPGHHVSPQVFGSTLPVCLRLVPGAARGAAVDAACAVTEELVPGAAAGAQRGAGLFDAVLNDAGIETVLNGVQMPRMNSIMERWVQTCLYWSKTRLLALNWAFMLSAGIR